MAATHQFSRPRLDEAPDALPPLEQGLSVHPGSEHSSRMTRFGLRAGAFDLVMLVVTALAVSLASPTSSPTGDVPTTPLGWLIAMSLTIVAVFYLRGMYVAPLRLEVLEALRLVVAGTALAITLTMAARVLLVDDVYVAAETIRFWLVALPLLGLGRCAVLWQEVRARRDGAATRRALIVGSGKVGMLTAT